MFIDRYLSRPLTEIFPHEDNHDYLEALDELASQLFGALTAAEPPLQLDNELRMMFGGPMGFAAAMKRLATFYTHTEEERGIMDLMLMPFMVPQMGKLILIHCNLPLQFAILLTYRHLAETEKGIRPPDERALTVAEAEEEVAEFIADVLWDWQAESPAIH